MKTEILQNKQIYQNQKFFVKSCSNKAEKQMVANLTIIKTNL